MCAVAYITFSHSNAVTHDCWFNRWEQRQETEPKPKPEPKAIPSWHDSRVRDGAQINPC